MLASHQDQEVKAFIVGVCFQTSRDPPFNISYNHQIKGRNFYTWAFFF